MAVTFPPPGRRRHRGRRVRAVGGVAVSSSPRLSRAAALLAFGTLAFTACSDSITAPSVPPTALTARFAAARSDEVQRAIAAQERHNPMLLGIPGVIGTAVG